MPEYMYDDQSDLYAGAPGGTPYQAPNSQAWGGIPQNSYTQSVTFLSPAQQKSELTLMQLRAKKKQLEDQLSALPDVGNEVRDWMEAYLVGRDEKPNQNVPYKDSGITAATRLWNAVPELGDNAFADTVEQVLGWMKNYGSIVPRALGNQVALAAEGIAGDPVEPKSWFDASVLGQYLYAVERQSYDKNDPKGLTAMVNAANESLKQNEAVQAVSDVGTVGGQALGAAAMAVGLGKALPFVGGQIGNSIMAHWNTRLIRQEIQDVDRSIQELQGVLGNAQPYDSNQEAPIVPNSTKPDPSTTGPGPDTSTTQSSDGNAQNTSNNPKTYTQEQVDQIIAGLQNKGMTEEQALAMFSKFSEGLADKFKITVPLPVPAVINLLWGDRDKSSASAGVGPSMNGPRPSRQTGEKIKPKHKLKKKTKSKLAQQKSPSHDHEREKKLAAPGSPTQKTGAKGVGDHAK